MALWKRQPRDRFASDTPGSESVVINSADVVEFFERFEKRKLEIEELHELLVHELTAAEITLHREKRVVARIVAGRIMEIDLEHMEDLIETSRATPQLLVSHPALPSIFKYAVHAAENSLEMIVIQEYESFESGRSPNNLSITPTPAAPGSLAIYDKFGSKVHESRHSDLQSALSAEAISLTDCELPNAYLSGLSFTDTSFRGANLSGASFNRCTFDSCDFRSTSLRNTQFVDCTFVKPSFVVALVEGTNFSGNSISDPEFLGAFIFGADFSRTRVNGGHFAHARISKTTFEESSLEDVSFRRARLSETNLFQTQYLGSTSFVGAEFDFSNIQLTRSDAMNLLRAMKFPLAIDQV